MGNWTPGPWFVQNATDVFSALGADSGDGMLADENDGWQIADCDVGVTFCYGEETELGHAVKRANARLIAAAPELLEAAENALAYLGGQLDPSASEAYEALSAAIAKATGEQP